MGRGRVRRCPITKEAGKFGFARQERRSPTGIARERETRTNNTAPRQSHAYKPTHHQPRRITPTWSAGLRPASRGSAKPAPTTPPPANLTPENPRIPNRAESRGAWSAGLRPASRGSAKPAPTTPPPINLTPTNPRIANRAESRRHGAPVSDRHRAGARNPPQRPYATPISRLGAPVFRPASRGSAKPAPTTFCQANVRRAPPPDHQGCSRWGPGTPARRPALRGAKLPPPVPAWRSSAPD